MLKVWAAPGSVTKQFMLRQEVPAAEVRKPQRDAELEEAALLFKTTRLSPLSVVHTSPGEWV